MKIIINKPTNLILEIRNQALIFSTNNLPGLDQMALDLKSLDKIEAFDISHISGSNVTASCIVFSDKGPEKKEYRSMNIKLRQSKKGVTIYHIIYHK